MKITVPKTSGFCYGVSLAVKEAENIISCGKGLIMYGEIVHNPDVVKALEEKGAITVDSPKDITTGDKDNTVLLIRAHGVPRRTEEELRKTGLELRDKTCPKVKKVHKTVRDEEKKGRKVLIVGNPNHPEVVGIVGQCEGIAEVIASVDDALRADLSGDISVVVQTTFNGKVFENIKKVILEKNPDAVIYNTMCPATNIRQAEIESLSKNADYVIVLGGKKSSNSLKLCEIAGRNTEAVLVEKPEELDLQKIGKKERVVVCGGSSTPFELINSAAMYLKRHFDAEIDYLI